MQWGSKSQWGIEVDASGGETMGVCEGKKVLEKREMGLAVLCRHVYICTYVYICICSYVYVYVCICVICLYMCVYEVHICISRLTIYKNESLMV